MFDQYDIATDSTITGPERLDRLERMHGAALDGLSQGVEALEVWRCRNLWGRLRWLVWGD